jgi:anti-anti-sigma factor
MTVHLDTGTTPPNRAELTSPAPDVAVVALTGEHDLGDHETLKTALARASVRAPNVVVDLTDCAFIDVTALALLLHSHAVVSKAGGTFAVVIGAESGPIARLADLVRVGSILPVHPSLAAAIAALDSI